MDYGWDHGSLDGILPLGITWSSESIKILGLVFTPQYFKTVSINWRLILEKVRSILAVWKRRDMSLYGRATVLNTFELSKVYYTAHVLTILMTYSTGKKKPNISIAFLLHFYRISIAFLSHFYRTSFPVCLLS